MKKLTLVALLAVVATALPDAQDPTSSSTTFVFTNVNVIPMDRETVVRDQHVVIADGKIVGIGPASGQVPTGATRIDGSGKFLMPALTEMHAHIPGGSAPDALIERTLFLYAANGLGTIRGMLGHPRHLAYRDRVAKGELFSPRIYTSGPSLNGQSVPTREAAIEAVTGQKAAGYDFLKIHPGIRRDVFDVLAAKAHEIGINFAGHVPLDVGLHRALEVRYRSIDHVDGYVEALSNNPTKSDFFGLNLVSEIDESKIPALVEATREAGTWIVPTQVLFDNLMTEEDPAAMAKRSEMRYVQPQEQIQKWIAQKEGLRAKYSAADRAKFLAVRRQVIKALHDAGVPLALGSDAPQWWNVPGFSAHRELQSLVRAGLTPYEALRTGTVRVAEYFGSEDAGTIAPGKRADLMLLEANPLEIISHSSRIAGVMLGGRWMAQAEIARRLEGSL